MAYAAKLNDMKAKYRKVLKTIFTAPINGNLEWNKIEKEPDQALPLKKKEFEHIFIDHIRIKQHCVIELEKYVSF